MAESMRGLKRSHRCTEVSTADIGREVTVMGWVQKSRNKGGIIFVDLRDRTGILQIIFEENDCGAESFSKAEKLRSEFVIAVCGRVETRSGAANPNLKTGTIEVRAKSLRILAELNIGFLVYKYFSGMSESLCPRASGFRTGNRELRFSRAVLPILSVS